MTAGPDRPRDQFPESWAYREQPRMRKVSAAALALSYCHLHSLERVAELHSHQAWYLARERRQAEETGWWLYERVLIPAMSGGVRFVPLPPGVVFTGDDGRTRMHLDNDCLAESVHRTVEVLQLSWSDFLAFHQRRPHCRVDHAATAPAAWLAPRDLAAVLWLEEAVRILACGGQPYQAARTAYDQHLGKPRRRRQPVEPAWLAEQLHSTLNRLWFALLHARLDHGDGPLWLHGPLVDETARPTWTYGPDEGGG